MQLGMIDLGGIGASLVRRLLAGGHDCVVYDKSPRLVAELAAERARGASSLVDLAKELDAPRVICLAVQATAVDDTIAAVLPHLEAGDILVDCGSSYYLDDVSRSRSLADLRIQFMDVGISGLIGGLDQGYCLTIGGDEATARYLDPMFRQLARGIGGVPSQAPGVSAPTTAGLGYLYCGPSGAGHFAKMIHDGIEYGVIAAYAQGLSILHGAKSRQDDPADEPGAPGTDQPRYQFNLPAVAEVWRHGSPLASSMLDLTARVLAEDPGLREFHGHVASTREGWFALRAAAAEAISIPVLASALYWSTRAGEPVDFSSRLWAAVHQALDVPREGIVSHRPGAGRPPSPAGSA